MPGWTTAAWPRTSLRLESRSKASAVKERDTVFEMEIGTNRPDAMNHYGVAREASVIYNLPLRGVDSKLPPAPGNSDFAIEIVDPAGCARYTARVIRGCERQTIS